jgi:hypothetical protein
MPSLHKCNIIHSVHYACSQLHTPVQYIQHLPTQDTSVHGTGTRSHWIKYVDTHSTHIVNNRIQ